MAFPPAILELDRMGWTAALGVFAAVSAVVILLGLGSLGSLGAARKWTAIGIRVALVGLIVLALGDAQCVREDRDLAVIVVRDASDSVRLLYRAPDGQPVEQALDEFLAAAAASRPPRDRLGVVAFTDRALIEALPDERIGLYARPVQRPGGGTDIAAGIKLAMSLFQKGYRHRLLLVSDGNQTVDGPLEGAIAAAAAAGVPIDVMPLDYAVENEVLLDRVATAKTWRRLNESFDLSIILRSTNTRPVTGQLTLLHNGQPVGQRRVSLAPATRGSDGSVQPSVNVETVRIPELRTAGVHEFKAVFDQPQVEAQVGDPPTKADRLASNNVAGTFVFVEGRGRILLVDNVGADGGRLLAAALGGPDGVGMGIEVERVGIDGLPASRVALLNYDAILLSNVPRSAVTAEQDRMLAQYVHDLGGGLVMVGGPDSFGAGGWQGSEVEKVLPVNMDVPAQRQLPQGALVLVMHSCEMPDGNYWGEQCALRAIDALSSRDYIGIVSYQWAKGGAGWDLPLQEKRDGTVARAAVRKMAVGDAPSFEDLLRAAIDGAADAPGLAKNPAAQKHIIIISDGDPAPPSDQTYADLNAAKITVSTVSVYPHGGGISDTMATIARRTGGRNYGPIEQNPAQLPQIFIVESKVVRRSLIQSDDKGIPVAVRPESGGEIIRGISRFNPLYAFVLTTRKPSPQVQAPLLVGPQSDPLLVWWQSGLGKAAAFTSDAHNAWAAEWVGSPDFAKFWAQVVRSVARPPMSSEFDVAVSREGTRARVSVSAVRPDGSFQTGLNLSGVAIGPEAQQQIRLVATGPGAYSGGFDLPEAGNYVVRLQYTAPDGKSGVLLSGISVNDSPELRELRSNGPLLEQIAARTAGRILRPFDAGQADLWTRQGLRPGRSSQGVLDWLLPMIMGLLLVDVAVRRIAWDRRAAARLLRRALSIFSNRRRSDGSATLDALRRKREEVVETRFKPEAGTPAAPADPSARFAAPAQAPPAPDLTASLGGAVEQRPDPQAPATPKPPEGGYTDSLLEAKRRARERMKKKENP